jgi:hypothetical protein
MSAVRGTYNIMGKSLRLFVVVLLLTMIVHRFPFVPLTRFLVIPAHRACRPVSIFAPHRFSLAKDDYRFASAHFQVISAYVGTSSCYRLACLFIHYFSY